MNELERRSNLPAHFLDYEQMGDAFVRWEVYVRGKHERRRVLGMESAADLFYETRLLTGAFQGFFEPIKPKRFKLYLLSLRNEAFAAWSHYASVWRERRFYRRRGRRWRC